MNRLFYQQYGKRIVDLVVGVILVVVLLPIFALIALVIVSSSRGTPIIVQTRVGLHGQLFRFLKFRSMRAVGIESGIQAEARFLASGGLLLKMANDPRVTAVGSILRTYSLDELPQLINVIWGDMSLVGPRPLLPFMLEHNPLEGKIRSVVKPGLTGYWQIYARNDSMSVMQMIEYDARYVQEISFRTDVKILVKTIPQVLKRIGAK